mgnify:CR=1 FL=1
MPMKKIFLIATLIPLLLAGYFVHPNDQIGLIPVTGEEPGFNSPALNNRSTLPNFVARIATSGDPDQIAGLFLTGRLELPVLQQPNNNPGFVSSDPDSVTQFRLASQYALSPNSPYSNFVNLDDPERKIISVNDLFFSIYAQPGRLILQTCIEADGQPSWGRLFIIAAPVAPFPQSEILM